MLVSVIIPIYNCAPYIQEAVESVLQCNQVLEVILVEDNSPDNSLVICEELERKHNKVRLLKNPRGQNLGAGLSRNIGIRNAKGKYIAFLDGDDVYNSNRFDYSIPYLEHHPSIQGVYESTEVWYFNNSYSADQLNNVQSENGIIGINKNVEPVHLFNHLTILGSGFFHLNALTLRNSPEEPKHFFSDLELSEDLEFIIKLSIEKNLAGGDFNIPVAKYRFHGRNRAIDHLEKTIYFRTLMWEQLIRWSNQVENIETRKIAVLRIRLIYDLVRYLRYSRKKVFIFIINTLTIMCHPLVILDFYKSRKLRKSLSK